MPQLCHHPDLGHSTARDLSDMSGARLAIQNPQRAHPGRSLSQAGRTVLLLITDRAGAPRIWLRPVSPVMLP